MSESLRLEAQDLMEQWINSDEDLEVDQFFEKYASAEYLDAMHKEHERLEALHARGIWE